jgi:hypothetical protein
VYTGWNTAAVHAPSVEKKFSTFTLNMQLSPAAKCKASGKKENIHDDILCLRSTA